MISSLIGSFLMSYIIIITFMNILDFPLHQFMLNDYPHIHIHKTKQLYLISLLFQLIACLTLLQVGHILPTFFSFHIHKLLCYIISITISIQLLFHFISSCYEEKYFITTLLLIINICFYFTLFNT